MSALQAIETARGFVGKAKWRHMGRKPWAMDCVGLVALSLDAGGYTITHGPKVYGREPWDDQLRKSLRAQFGEPVMERRAGDVALVCWGRGEPSHVGLLADYWLGGLSIIHCTNKRGPVETALTESILDCVVEVYRPKWTD